MACRNCQRNRRFNEFDYKQRDVQKKPLINNKKNNVISTKIIEKRLLKCKKCNYNSTKTINGRCLKNNNQLILRIVKNNNLNCHLHL